MSLSRRLMLVALTAALGSCSGPSPTAPSGFLTGSWSASSPAGYFRIVLQSSGGTVQGTAVSVCCGTAALVTNGTVKGAYGGGGFTLEFSFPAGVQAGLGLQDTWTGHLTSAPGGDDELSGAWRETAPVDSLIGTRLMLRDQVAPSP